MKKMRVKNSFSEKLCYLPQPNVLTIFGSNWNSSSNRFHFRIEQTTAPEPLPTTVFHRIGIVSNLQFNSHVNRFRDSILFFLLAKGLHSQVHVWKTNWNGKWKFQRTNYIGVRRAHGIEYFQLGKCNNVFSRKYYFCVQWLRGNGNEKKFLCVGDIGPSFIFYCIIILHIIN